MKIGIYISELLFDHENVILPGFGMFSTEYIPARFIPEQKKVESPSKIISFNGKIKEGESPLIPHISQREEIDKEVVWKFIRDFVGQMKESINSGSKVELQNVGVFRKGGDSEILFEPDRSINYLSDASGLSSVNEPGKTEPEPVFIPPVKSMDIPPEPVANTNYQEESIPQQDIHDEDTPYYQKGGYEEQKQEKSNGLPSALRWIAYTVVPLLIIIIILGYNFSYFFGEGGVFRSSEKPAISQQQTASPEEVAPEYLQDEEAATEVIEEQPQQQPDPSAEPPLPQTGRPVYYIVVGSFENHHQAQSLAEDLRKEGASLASIFMQTPAGFYRVAYGYYYDLQQAEDQLLSVQQEVNPNAWVLHR